MIYNLFTHVLFSVKHHLWGHKMVWNCKNIANKVYGLKFDGRSFDEPDLYWLLASLFMNSAFRFQDYCFFRFEPTNLLWFTLTEPLKTTRYLSSTQKKLPSYWSFISLLYLQRRRKQSDNGLATSALMPTRNHETNPSESLAQWVDGAVPWAVIELDIGALNQFLMNFL